MSKAGITAYVSGTVQGVGFRFFTQRKANELKLTGHVCNMHDGQVEVVAYGESANIEALVTWLRNGEAPGAQVKKVVTKPCELIEAKEFSIRY